MIALLAVAAEIVAVLIGFAIGWQQCDRLWRSLLRDCDEANRQSGRRGCPLEGACQRLRT